MRFSVHHVAPHRVVVVATLSIVAAVGCGDNGDHVVDAQEAPDGPATDAPADAAPAHSWVKQFGEASAHEIEGANAVASDATGNIVFVGDLWGAADFGGGVLTSAGGEDLFVAKLDAGGGHVWSRRFGDAGAFQSARGVATDAVGSVVFAGEFDGSVDFGDGSHTSAGGGDIFLAKLDGGGTVMWSKAFGDAVDGQRARGVTVDHAGNVIVVGEFAGTVSFGGEPLTATGGADAFVAKFDPSGHHQWSHRFGGAGKTTIAAVRTDAADNIVLVGEFGLTVDVDGSPTTGDPLVSLGGQDAFVIKLDPAGGHVWSRRLGGPNKRQSGDAVAIDANGDVLIASTFEGTVNFGGDDLVSLGTALGASDVGIVKLTSTGAHLWSHGYGDASRQFVRAVAFDAAGNALLAGQFTGTINFGAGDLSSNAKPLFLVKLDPGGAELRALRVGDAGEVAVGPGGLTVDVSGNLVVAGRFSGMADFGTGALTTPAGDYDCLVAKLVGF